MLSISRTFDLKTDAETWARDRRLRAGEMLKRYTHIEAEKLAKKLG
ncbi:MAG: hypothetical protein RBR52_00725 [Thiomonas sp.]|nr:hypothetical protein [Thiomonas sp.]MDY0329003.1 hypothetical protein [Thiomonas sp.]